MNERQLTMEEGRAEAERFRPDRIRNYRIKRAANFTCQHEGCTTDIGVVVVRVGKGESDDSFSTRCVPHLGRFKPTPGQWIERSAA